VKRIRESGYTVKEACEALGLSRSSYYVSLKELERLDPGNGDRDKVQEVREEGLLERIKSLKASIPFGVIVGLRRGLGTEKALG